MNEFDAAAVAKIKINQNENENQRVVKKQIRKQSKK